MEKVISEKNLTGQSGLSHRPSFKKSHTCGSLFANCSCSSATKSGHEQRRKKFFQSYSHPDTTYIFTHENKTPSTKNKTYRAKSGRMQISNSKRLSTPNIGNYTILDVAVHPEIVLTVSHTNGLIEPKYADNQPTENRNLSKPILERSPTLYRGDSLKSYELLECLENEEDLLSSKKNSHENNLILSSDSPMSINNTRLKLDLDLKFANSPAHTKNELNRNSKMDYTNAKYNSPIKPQLSYNKSLNTSPVNYCDTDESKQKYNNYKLMSTSLTDIVNLGKNNEINPYLKKLMIYPSTRQSSDESADECSLPSSQRMSKQEEPQQEELLKLKEIIKDRDNEINKLKREIHKLKSVLQQTSKYMQSRDDELSPHLLSNNEIPAQHSLPQLNENINCNISCNISLNQTNKPSYIVNQILSAPLLKKQGVSGESSDATGQLSRDILIRKYEKDFSSKQLIKDAIMDNDFLKHIDSSQIRELVDSMYNRKVVNGEYVIREGDVGTHLFVSAEGDFEVMKDNKILGKMGPGKAFGELAILYNCTRTASVKVLCDSRVWVLDRRVFQQIMMRTGMQRIEENINFLRSVPLLKNLSNNLLAKIADVLEVEFYPAGAYVIRQGASGDTFFLISQGNVKVTQKLSCTQIDEEEIRILGRGDYFGEQALIKEDKRTANIIAMPPGVECLTLDRESFTHLIGDLCELHEKDYGDETRVLAMKRIESNGLLFGSDTKQELLDVELEYLKTIATLGVGGFGRVDLVKYEKNNAIQTYALKRLKKQHIVDTHQEEHVYSERTIMLSCKTPFICRLYRTYRDSKYVYMLLEACMGGEVWTLLRNRGYFDDIIAKFVIGCVLQALEYLHSRGIVYRDLKPENLMLGSNGYIKLVDFGFSKCIGYSSKTWTFCGTPEYVAPEIILNKGHDRAVDYWALGILIHELLTGTPPFTSCDPMKTYNIILKGIDMVDFPKHMSRAAITLIKRLCRDIPSERLGYQRGGTQNIRKQRWFQGFDWEGLVNLTLKAPFSPRLSSPLDTSNFDYFPMEDDIATDEFSGWDKDF